MLATMHCSGYIKENTKIKVAKWGKNGRAKNKKTTKQLNNK
jgi:hypothetical protein